ncbi:MAG TPA: DedA family protein [Ilumatobacter sp.]|nr:DedA family protein [Ilumatobacter sp.]
MTGVLLANIVTDATDWLEEISSHWWFLIIIFVIAYLDSVIPIVPSETTVIIGGVAAGSGQQEVLLVIAAGALGAFLGDNTAYLIGERFSRGIERRAARKPKLQLRLDWATAQIRLRGGLLLITARFIPGGRTALTLSSGITHQPRSWFIRWIAVAAVIWATYAALLGYIGGKAFEDNHTAAFLVAFGAALSITVIIELVRHFRNKENAQHERL